MPRKIEISHKTIVFTVLFLISLWFLFFIREIILQFFVALIIMAILNPMVTRLSKFKIPRGISILVAYLILLGLIGFAVGGIIPPLVDQTTSFAIGLPQYLENLGIPFLVREQVLRELLSLISSIPGQVVKIGVSVVSNFISVLAVLIFAFYLLLERKKLDDQLAVFFGKNKIELIERIIDNLEKRLGSWARGELSLMFLVGVSSYIGLRLLGIPFAVPLSILAGLLEIVPYIGPILAAVPAVLIGFSISPIMGLATMALAFLIQQVENYFFVPKVMERSTGVHPVITLLALAIGFKLAGVVGVLISVPLVICLMVLAKEHPVFKTPMG